MIKKSNYKAMSIDKTYAHTIFSIERLSTTLSPCGLICIDTSAMIHLTSFYQLNIGL